MSNSSQQPTSSNDLFNDVTIILSDDVVVGDITIPTYSGIGSYTTASSMNSMNSMNTITLTSGGAVGSSYSINDTITLNTDYQFNWGDAEEWIDSFPDWQRVQDMCKKYPGLEIALRNFQTVYTRVKDDYANPKDEK